MRPWAAAAAPPSAAAAAASKLSAALQMMLWQVPAYLGHLHHLSSSASGGAGSGGDAAGQERQQPAAASVPAAPHQLQLQLQQQQKHHGQAQLLHVLASDVLAKQQALERLQRQLDVAGLSAELADSRLAELRDTNWCACMCGGCRAHRLLPTRELAMGRTMTLVLHPSHGARRARPACSTLTQDLDHLRQLLHEEKEAAASARGLLDASEPHLLPGSATPAATASREQLLAALSRVAEAGSKERARNAELVHRLQALHAQRVDVVEQQRQYLELQEAHFQQVCVCVCVCAACAACACHACAGSQAVGRCSLGCGCAGRAFERRRHVLAATMRARHRGTRTRRASCWCSRRSVPAA
jgi:hypothetical protein